MPEPDSCSRLGQEIGSVGHALHATGNDHMRIAGADRLRGEHDRLQPGAADLVYREGAHALGDAGADGRLARGVLTEPRSENIAHHDLVHGLRRDARAPDRLGNR